MIMELEELKTRWNEYDEKLQKNLQLNMILLRKINFDKTRNKLKTFFVFKLIEMIIIMFQFIYLIGFTIDNIKLPQFSTPAVILEIAIVAYFILDVRMFALINDLHIKNSNGALAPLQKKTEKLKLLIVTYVKYSLFLIPFYPILMQLAGKIFLNIDFLSPQFRNYFISNVVVGLLLLPAFIWLFRQLSQKEIKQNWVKSLLSGTGWNQANEIEKFLMEIEDFEQE